MRNILLISSLVAAAASAYGQSAINAYRYSQPDMKGTARFMGMAGAFTALGGDLSTISQNPGGIGIYRNNEVGFTLDLDCQHSTSESGPFKSQIDQTKFYLNNIGFVWSIKLPSVTCPNINFGFTYNKNTSYNRRYNGFIGLDSSTQSLSNYIAYISSINGYNKDMLGVDEDDNYNPYDSSNIDWLSILGYQGYLISPESDNTYIGQWNDRANPSMGREPTYGYGYFDVIEKGAVDSYNIALGGNISNVVFWGMDFDITHMNYTLTPDWNENLANAFVGDNNGTILYQPSSWLLSNYYNCSGTGFNYKLGVIVKPIQELRFGFAFHTPTWYNLTQTFYGDIWYNYDLPQDYDPYNSPSYELNDVRSTDNGELSYNNISFRTPWKITAGAAAVLFNSLILSFDYEWAKYDGMKFSESFGYYGGSDGYFDPWDDPWFDPWDPWYSKAKPGQYIASPSNNPYDRINNNVKSIYRSTNTIRLGAEYRLLPQLSIRAGYSHISSPIKYEARNSSILTAGTIPNYRFDNDTNYITAGIGYKYKNFYVDAAYVFKHMSSEYHAYTSWQDDYTDPVTGMNTGHSSQQPWGVSPTSKINFYNSQIVLSAGFKF